MTAPVRGWPCGRPDDALRRQIDHVARQADVVRLAVMPDVHQGRTVPNGIVVATRRIVYPQLVGADIGCGIAALAFDGRADDLSAGTLAGLLDALPAVIPTLKQPRERACGNRATLDGLGTLTAPRLDRAAARDGLYQIGTLGRGNHFLELARDGDGILWAVVHSGSRSIGQEITAHHLAGIAADSGDLPGLDLDTPAGRGYLADAQWACRYAAANRAAMLNAVADLLEQAAGVQADPASFVDSPHNTVSREVHDGEPLVVHRKSANHAEAGRRGIVAGSMAAGSRLVVGLGDPGSLASSAHGAGRVLSRTAARQRIHARDLAARMRGIAFHRDWADRFRDEAPQAYRDLRDVMRAQQDLVRTERELVPILNDKRP